MKIIILTIVAQMLLLFSIVVFIKVIKNNKNSFVFFDTVIWSIFLVFGVFCMQVYFPVVYAKNLLRWEFFVSLFFLLFAASKSYSNKYIPFCFLYALLIAYCNAGYLSFYGYIVYLLLFLSLMLLAVEICYRHKEGFSGKILSFILKVFFSFVFVFSAGIKFYLFSHHRIYFGADEINAFMQSNIVESVDFITTSCSKHEIVSFIILFFLVFLALFYLERKLYSSGMQALKPKYVVGIMLFIACLILVIILSLNFIFFEIISNFRSFEDLKEKNFTAVNARKEQQGELYIVVIGESDSRDHWGAYGYFRNTTPYMKEQRSNDNFIFLENAYAAYVQTVPVLLKALTEANQYNDKKDFVSPSIIDVAKAADFEVIWISNQSKFGFFDNPLTIIASYADKSIFTGFPYDDMLVSSLEEVLLSVNPQKNTLVFIHLNGAHFKYSSKVPEKSKVYFSNPETYIGDKAKDKSFLNETLDAYDNVVYYTDNNLNKFYNIFLKAPQESKMFVYFSDHAEDVMNENQHNAAKFTWDMTRIPAFFAFSKAYKNSYSETIKNLYKNSASVWTNDLFFDAMIGIMNIQYEYSEKQYDISSSKYAINKDNALTMKLGAYYTENLNKLGKKQYVTDKTHKISEDPNLK